MRPLVATVAGLLILAACGGQAAPSTTEAGTTPSATVAPTVATTATTVTPETTGAPSTTASVALDFPDFAVPFSLGEQPGWTVTEQLEDWAIELSSSPPRVLLVTTEGPGPAIGESEASVDLWVDHVNSDEFVEAIEVGESTVGGLSARVLDLRLLPGDERGSACGRPCFVLLNRSVGAEGSGGFGWALYGGSPNRAWLVDVNGTTVTFFAESSEDDFETWVAEVEAALAELVWTG